MYYNFLLVATTPKGGYFSDVFVFPLRKLGPDDIDPNGNIKLPNNGELTFYDGVGGSIISGNLAAWNKINLYLVDNIEKNAHDSFKRLEKGLIHHERQHILVNLLDRQNPEICEKTKSKFVVRLHNIDLKVMNVPPMSKTLRDQMVFKWLEHYRKMCWH